MKRTIDPIAMIVGRYAPPVDFSSSLSMVRVNMMKKHPYDDVQFFEAGATTSLTWGMNAVELVYVTK